MTCLVPECSPLGVDDHVLGVTVVPVPSADPLSVLQVAGVGACAENKSNPTLGVLPGAGHQAARRVVQHGAHVNLDVAPSSDGLPAEMKLIIILLIMETVT